MTCSCIQLHAEVSRDLDDHREEEPDLQTTIGGSGKGEGSGKG
jgi:hypothetical protein